MFIAEKLELISDLSLAPSLPLFYLLSLHQVGLLLSTIQPTWKRCIISIPQSALSWVPQCSAQHFSSLTNETDVITSVIFVTHFLMWHSYTHLNNKCKVTADRWTKRKMDENYSIVYLPSCSSKPEWLTFFQAEFTFLHKIYLPEIMGQQRSILLFKTLV